MGEWVYSANVQDHFMHPRNILLDETGYHEDGKGFVGNVTCGDMMMMVIKVDKSNDTIAECKWRTFGCASAIASTSKLSEMVIGMALETARKIKPQDIIDALGGLPEHKIHCSVLGDKALREAINDYYKRSGQDSRVVRENVKIICECLQVTDADIEEAVLEGVRSWEQLQERTKIGTGCGKCHEEAKTVLAKTILHYKMKKVS